MDGTPYIRYPYPCDAEAREDQECNSYAGKKCGIDRWSYGDAPDKNRETEHSDCHRKYLPEGSHGCVHTGCDPEMADSDRTHDRIGIR